MKLLLLPVAGAAFAAALCSASVSAQPAIPAVEKPMETNVPVGSFFLDWDAMVPKKTATGIYRAVVDAPTSQFSRFEMHVTTLNPGHESHPPHHHPQEELIIVTKGHVEGHINGKGTTIGPGSLLFFASHDPHNAQNNGTEPATYYVINFYTTATGAVRNQPAHEWEGADLFHSAAIDWETLKPVQTAADTRRAFVNSPTLTFKKLEIHATTVEPGRPASKAHRHPWPMLVIVKDGAVEASVDGISHVTAAGGIIYMAPNALQSMRNAGSVPATYFVVSVASEQTPS